MGGRRLGLSGQLIPKAQLPRQYGRMNTSNAPAASSRTWPSPLQSPAVTIHVAEATGGIVPSRLAGRTWPQPASLPRLMASALAALGLMGRAEGAEADMVPWRTRTQICDTVRRESPYLHEVLSVLASVGEGAVQNGPQLFIAQDSFSTAGAHACLAALCAIDSENEHASFWLMPPAEFSRESVTRLARQGREVETKLMATLTRTSVAAPTRRDKEMVALLDELLTAQSADSSFFYPDGDTPNGSDVMRDPGASVVSARFEHGNSLFPAEAIDKRMMAMMFATGWKHLQPTLDRGIAQGLPVVIVALDAQHNVTIFPSIASLESMRALADRLGPHMTLLGQAEHSTDHQSAGPEADADVGAAPNSLMNMGVSVFSMLAATGIVLWLPRKCRQVPPEAPPLAQQAPAPQDKARQHRTRSAAAGQRPAQTGTRSLDDADKAAAQANPIPPLTRKPPPERDPKRIADAVAQDLRSTDKNGRKKLLGVELGPRIVAAMTAPDHTCRVDAAGILLGLANVAVLDESLKLLFKDLDIALDFDQILQPVLSASRAHPLDSDLHRAAELLAMAAPRFRRALADTGPDTTRYGARLGPARQRPWDGMAATEEKKRPAETTASPARVRINLGAAYQHARALAGQAAEGELPYGAFDTGKVTIPRADRDPHIHVEAGFIAFRKGKDDNWQLTDGDFLLVRHVQAALAGLGPNPERNPYNVPIVAFLLHLLSLANETSAVG
jgi:hypothetical protein